MIGINNKLIHFYHFLTTSGNSKRLVFTNEPLNQTQKRAKGEFKSQKIARGLLSPDESGLRGTEKLGQRKYSNESRLLE